MNKKELSNTSLSLEHTVVLEEYKLLITFALGLITGVTLATIYNTPAWYYYTMGSCLFSALLWVQLGEPLRRRLIMIHASIRAL